MNEQIQKLADQAFQYASDNADESGKGSLGVFAEKFAELIVRECMEQVWYTREDKIDETISQNIKTRMATHFGVEE